MNSLKFQKSLVRTLWFFAMMIIVTGQIFAQQTVTFQFKSNEFIKNWLVCGPFPNENGKSIDTDFLIHDGGETAIQPALGNSYRSESVPDGTVRWIKARAEDSGKLNFVDILTPNNKNVVYAATIIKCDRITPAILKLGSNDRLKVWLNGKLVHVYSQPRAGGPDTDQIPVELNKGKNLLLAKVDNIGGGWWLYARFEGLLSLDGQLYMTAPMVGKGPKRISKAEIADLISIMVFNVSKKDAGPLTLAIKGRKSVSKTIETIGPKQNKWLTLESIVDAKKAKKEFQADVLVSTEKGSKVFKIRTKRSLPMDGTTYFVQGFHVDPIWRDSQSGYQALSFSNLRQYLDAVVSDSAYGLHLHEIPYLKPYYDEHPQDRALIRSLVKQGRIETGGSYNQPNETTISGEALIRNILYGRLFDEKVLQDNPRVYPPWDVFGHIIQLPQILTKSGFIGTTWERGNYRSPFVRVPDIPDLYRAMSPDGSTLLTRKVRYGFDVNDTGQYRDLDAQARGYFAESLVEQQQQIPGIDIDFRLNATDEKMPTPWIIGRCDNFKTYIPRVDTRADGDAQYFRDAQKEAVQKQLDIPIVSRDVSQYNEGCELSRFDLKMGNRLSENTLVSAEKFATIANILGSKYPARELDRAWRLLLFGQHHDGVSGCGADVPYLDLAANYHEALELGANALFQACDFISNKINTSQENGIPLVVFNPLNWQRTDVVRQEIHFDQPVKGFQLTDENGRSIDCVIEKSTGKNGKITDAEISFIAEDIPSIGYKTFYIVAGNAQPPIANGKKIDTRVIENKFYRMTVDENAGGGITSLVDKKSGKEFIKNSTGHPGNELILLKEGAGFEPAWRFLTTGKKSFSKDKACNIQVFENPLYKKIIISGEMDRLKKRVQEIILYINLQRIDFRTILVDYQGLNGKNIREDDDRPRRNDRDFYCIGFPADLQGAVPVLEDRFATKTYYQSKNKFDFYSTNTEWTAHHAMNSCNQWIDYSQSVKISFADGGSIALGPTEILTSKDMKLRRAGFQLEQALAKRGITNTPGFDTVKRGYDIQYRRFSFSIGVAGKNQYNNHLLARLGKKVRKNFEKQIDRNGYAYLFVYDDQVEGAWFNLPVLMVVGKNENMTLKAVDKLVDQLTSSGNLAMAAGVNASKQKTEVPDYGLSIINRGNMPVSIENDGTMVLALMHTVPWQSPLLQWTHDFPERKTHVFEYALMPHKGNWREAGLVRRGYEYNNPLVAVQTTVHRGDFPAQHSFFSTGNAHVVITALKPKSNGDEAFSAKTPTDARNGVIVRCYETYGVSSDVTLQSSFPITAAGRVNLVEKNAREIPATSQSVQLPVGANAIETMLLSFNCAKRIENQQPSHSAAPVYAKYWQHNEGAAPVGYLPVSVNIMGKLKFAASEGAHWTVQQLHVAVTNDFVDEAVDGKVKIQTPPGLRAAPAEIDFHVPANSESFYPVSIVLAGSGSEPGFVRAEIEFRGQRIFDVLQYGLPEKSFGHAENTTHKKNGLQWQVHRKGDQIIAKISNPFAQAIDGAVTLIGPVETWGLPQVVNPAAFGKLLPWEKAFHVPANGEQTLKFSWTANDLLPPDERVFWVVAKLSYFGYLDYKVAVGKLAIQD